MKSTESQILTVCRGDLVKLSMDHISGPVVIWGGLIPIALIIFGIENCYNFLSGKLRSRKLRQNAQQVTRSIK